MTDEANRARFSPGSMSALREQRDKVEALITDGALDDMVHDTAIVVAGQINNRGGYRQVEWLWEHGVSYTEMLKHLEDA
jgi:hypothetical protein